MREIKFRAWDKENKRFIELFYTTVLELNAKETDMVYMQYTGLKDKNGKEIYEGDIVKDDMNFLATVGWNDGAFILNIKDHDTDMAGEDNNKFYKVIGNIYENSELLKERVSG